MIEVERTSSDDALGVWGDEIARYADRQSLLGVTRARAGGRIEGTRWGINDRHPLESADEQRSFLARAIRAEVRDADAVDRRATLLVFDHYWQPSTVISRRRGGERLLETWQRDLGTSPAPIGVSSVIRGSEIRWFATLPFALEQLEQLLGALERGAAALTLSADSPPDAADLFHDLFNDSDGELTTHKFWPSWAARRASRGERVLLAKEHNDHTGREAFLLGSTASAR